MDGFAEVDYLLGGAVDGAVDPIAERLSEALDGLFGDGEALVEEVEGYMHACILKEIFGFHEIGGYLIEDLFGVGNELIMDGPVLLGTDQAQIILVEPLQIVILFGEILLKH